MTAQIFSLTADRPLVAKLLSDLPTHSVMRIYSYASRRFHTLPAGHPDEIYYLRMRERAEEELQKRSDARDFQASSAE